MKRLLWSNPDVPNNEWSCIGTIDICLISDEYEKCEMCGHAPLRWVHYMSHTNYHDILGVGYVCAGKMTGEYREAKERDKKLREKTKMFNQAHKRLRKTFMKTWNTAQNGNVWQYFQGILFIVHRYAGFWKARIYKNPQIIVIVNTVEEGKELLASYI